MPSTEAEPRWVPWLEWAALLAIIILAAYLRYWRIEEVPPGFNSDEAVGAMGALTTLREGVRYSYEGQGGAGALGFYFAAAAFYLFGPSIASIRGVAAWAGVVSIFANYWAVREIFRQGEGLSRARWLAVLSSLGLAVSLWHISTSRIAFAAIGVPFLMLPSVYFLWLGLNNRAGWWTNVLSGLFLGASMYIYLSGVFAPPFYAAFFVAQWLLVKTWQRSAPANSSLGLLHRFKSLQPAEPYLTSRFWRLFVTGLTTVVLLLPMIYVLFNRPELEPGTTRVSQAFFLNPRINQGDPWGLLWRSIIGNFGAYGVSLSWLIGQAPRLVIPVQIGLVVFLGFLISLWQALRGRAAYLFILLWYGVLLLPSILAPDIIPHNLRTIGATTPTYVFAAVFIVWLFELAWTAGWRWLPGPARAWAPLSLGAALVVIFGWNFWQATRTSLYQYFYLFPETNDAKAAYHVYAVKMAEVINNEPRSEVAFVLPRNTAAGDVFRNYTTDFLTELAQPPAAHFWVIDDERTVPDDLTLAAAAHPVIRLVSWKTSKHTGADPKTVLPYYLEKYGYYQGTDTFEYFDIDTYVLEVPAPDFRAGETLEHSQVDFGGQIRLTGYALGDAGDVSRINEPAASSNGLLWLRLAWQKTGDQPENLKVSALVYGQSGQLVTQMDKLLISNILQVGSKEWNINDRADTYFLLPVPPATPPGQYTLKLAVYGEDSLARLPINGSSERGVEAGSLLTLAEFTVTPARQPVDPDNLHLALPVRQELLPGLTLVGFETLPGQTVRAGQQIGASLVWLAGSTALPPDLVMSLSAKAGEGEEEWALSEPAGLAGPGYPTSAWQPGELLRGWLMARVPPTLEPGLYKLRLRLAQANGQQEVLVLPVGDFQVEGWSRVFEPPRPQRLIGADFAGQATLLGLDAPATRIAPGETLNVRLFWRCEAEFDRDYTAFVHIIGPDGLLYGQVDQPPGAGAFPTSGWVPGEYIADEYAIPVAQQAPPGMYQLEIGLYDPGTGQRLPVFPADCGEADCQQDNRVLLPGLSLVK